MAFLFRSSGHTWKGLQFDQISRTIGHYWNVSVGVYTPNVYVVGGNLHRGSLGQ